LNPSASLFPAAECVKFGTELMAGLCTLVCRTEENLENDSKGKKLTRRVPIRNGGAVAGVCCNPQRNMHIGTRAHIQHLQLNIVCARKLIY